MVILMDKYIYEEIDKRIDDIRDKWNAIAKEQGNTDNVDEFMAKNNEMIFNDLTKLLDMCELVDKKLRF